MLDNALILRKVAELERYLGQVGEYSSIGLEEYRADWKVQRIVERTLQIMIETCADIASHIVAGNDMRIPTGYADTFRVLSEHDVISPNLFSVMERMAKFRNILVHQYESVDAEIVVLVLKKHLRDFLAFRDSVLTFLASRSS